MKTLTIFYDPGCGMCAAFRTWLEAQPKHVATDFVSYQSAEAAAKFPGLDKIGADRDIVVLADDGRWWQGEPAWLTCLWTTRGFRVWAFRLAGPIFRPVVKKAVHLLSENRLTLSRLLDLKTDAQLASALAAIPTVASCGTGTCTIPTFTPHLK